MTARSFFIRRWLPRGRVARRSRGPLLGGLWLRCLTWWRAKALDERLAAGVDPLESDELSLRAGQLGSAKTRTRLARGLEGAVELGDRQIPPVSAPQVLLRRSEVRACRTPLLQLAERVRAAGPHDVQGLAITSFLVSDRASPLYQRDPSRSLSAVARAALVALELPGTTGDAGSALWRSGEGGHG
jgi:hypothetical protein